MFRKTLLVLFLIINFAEAKIVSINTKDNTELKFDLIKPKNNEPDASLILFAGGGGYLKMDKEKWKKKGNFLVRTRKIFRDNNFAVAVVDAPSEYRTNLGMPAHFRTSQKHLEDTEAVIEFMKNKFKKPIWIIGTSRGTLSASHIAINSKNINGLVLSASITDYNKRGDLKPITTLDLDKIKVPTLIVHHKMDGCYVSNPYGAQKIFERLKTTKKEIKIFKGGLEKNNPCKGHSYHGFYKIEEDVISYISNFIKEN